MTSWKPPAGEPGAQASALRRRRARSLLPFIGQEERDQALDDLAQRAFPRLNFFLFTLLAAFLISLGYVFSSPIFLIAGLAFSPLLSPLTGTALGLVTASVRFAVRNLAALVLAWILAFAAAWTAAYLFSFMPVRGEVHPLLDLLTALAVGLASIALTWRFLRGASDAWMPNVIVFYGCLYPLCAAAWWMTAGNGEAALTAWLAWGIRSAIALLVSVGTYLAFGFHPSERNIRAYAGMAAAGAVGIALLLAWIGTANPAAPSATTPAAVMLPTASPTLSPIPSLTPTATETPLPTETLPPTVTLTPTIPPVLARVHGVGEQGAFLRDGPGLDAKKIGSLQEDEAVEILGPPVDKDGMLWVPVRTASGERGWMAMEFCATLTPTRTP